MELNTEMFFTVPSPFAYGRTNLHLLILHIPVQSRADFVADLCLFLSAENARNLTYRDVVGGLIEVPGPKR